MKKRKISKRKAWSKIKDTMLIITIIALLHPVYIYAGTLQHFFIDTVTFIFLYQVIDGINKKFNS